MKLSVSDWLPRRNALHNRKRRICEKIHCRRGTGAPLRQEAGLVQRAVRPAPGATCAKCARRAAISGIQGGRLDHPASRRALRAPQQGDLPAVPKPPQPPERSWRARRRQRVPRRCAIRGCTPPRAPRLCPEVAAYSCPLAGALIATRVLFSLRARGTRRALPVLQQASATPIPGSLTKASRGRGEIGTPVASYKAVSSILTPEKPAVVGETSPAQEPSRPMLPSGESPGY